MGDGSRSGPSTDGQGYKYGILGADLAVGDIVLSRGSDLDPLGDDMIMSGPGFTQHIAPPQSVRPTTRSNSNIRMNLSSDSSSQRFSSSLYGAHIPGYEQQQQQQHRVDVIGGGLGGTYSSDYLHHNHNHISHGTATPPRSKHPLDDSHGLGLGLGLGGDEDSDHGGAIITTRVQAPLATSGFKVEATTNASLRRSGTTTSSSVSLSGMIDEGISSTLTNQNGTSTTPTTGATNTGTGTGTGTGRGATTRSTRSGHLGSFASRYSALTGDSLKPEVKMLATGANSSTPSMTTSGIGGLGKGGIGGAVNISMGGNGNNTSINNTHSSSSSSHSSSGGGGGGGRRGMTATSSGSVLQQGVASSSGYASMTTQGQQNTVGTTGRRGGRKTQTQPIQETVEEEEEDDEGDQDPRDPRSKQRMQRKAELARQSRVRRKVYLESLEQKVRELQAEKDGLEQQLSAFTSPYSALHLHRSRMETERKTLCEQMAPLIAQHTHLVQKGLGELPSSQQMQLEAYVKDYRVRMRSLQANASFQLEQLEQDIAPSMPARFLLWGMTAKDGLNDGSFFLKILKDELGLTQTQIDETRKLKNYIKRDYELLGQCQKDVAKLREQVMTHFQSLNRTLESVERIYTPIQLAKYFTWIENNQWSVQLIPVTADVAALDKDEGESEHNDGMGQQSGITNDIQSSMGRVVDGQTRSTQSDIYESLPSQNSSTTGDIYNNTLSPPPSDLGVSWPPD